VLKVVLGGAFAGPAAEDVAFVGIVPGALLRVGEDLVGSLDFSEEGGCACFVTVVAVWVELEGLSAVGFLDADSMLEDSRQIYEEKEEYATYSSSVAVLSTSSSS
jgi:hypothetical protein